MKTTILWITLLLCLGSCAQKQQVPFQGKTEGEKLHQFLEWSFDTIIERHPMQMAVLGIKKRENELDDLSEKYSKETLAIYQQHLAMLAEIDRSKLDQADRLNYDLAKFKYEMFIENWNWKDYTYAVNQMFGIQSELPSFMINVHMVKSEQDAQNYIARLRQFKNFMGDVITGLMRSETLGVVPPKFVFPKVIDDSQNVIAGYPIRRGAKDSPLMADFRKKVSALEISEDKKKKLIADAEEAIQSSVYIGYSSLIHFLKDQEKRASDLDGVWKFPKGDDYFKFRVRLETTTQLSPDQIHQIGLDNVKRIHSEMSQIKDKVGFKGDLPAFFKHMQSSKYYFKNSKDGKSAYLKMATNYIDTMRGELDRLFFTKPAAAMEVRPVEAYREKSAGLAFYQNAAIDGSRPGAYYVNLNNMKALPRWEAEALAYHEGIPGHHMQISLAQENLKLPKFRRFGDITAYSEGWGLYSERLPKDYGFYSDPYSDFGRLSMELARACRLVADTGIHHKKWTRQQAIDFLDKNTPADHHDNVQEVNRYIVFPGQANAYLIGMLKIVDLKEKAKREMGSKFDIRRFHETILSSGPVPLETMESLVDDYIKAG